MQQREPNYQLCLPMFSEALAKNLFDLFPWDARHPHAARAGDARTSREWFLNVNQSVVRRGQTGARRRCFFLPRCLWCTCPRRMSFATTDPDRASPGGWITTGAKAGVWRLHLGSRLSASLAQMKSLICGKTKRDPSASDRLAGAKQTAPQYRHIPSWLRHGGTLGEKKKIIWLTYPSACWLLSVILHLHGIIIFSPLPFVDSSEFESI